MTPGALPVTKAQKEYRQGGEAADDVELSCEVAQKEATVSSESEPRWQFRTLGKEGY